MSSENPAPGPRKVDTIIHAEWLLPMDGSNEILQGFSLAIADQKILAIVETAKAAEQFSAGREFSLDHHVVMPGLINAHGHAPMSLFRGYADDIPLKPWLEQRIWPAEGRWVSEEFVYDGACIAIAEMLLAGITCFNDMYFFPDQVARAALQARIRTQLASPILDFPTPWGRNAEDYIHKATALHDEYKNDQYVYTAFGPHATYTVSDEPLRKIAMLADELDIPIHIHLHECPGEVSDAVAGTGLRPIARLDGLGLLTPRLQAVHMTQLDEAEIELLHTNAVHVVHCPSSNLKLASGLCPVVKLMNAGVNVCIGTDGAASNNDLDIIGEMQLASLIGKMTANDAAALPASDALEMITINGARCLGLDEQIGSLEVGKLADIIALDMNHINTRPLYDPVSALAYSAHSSQISHVWVGGHLNVENRKLLSLDLASLVDRADIWASRISNDS